MLSLEAMERVLCVSKKFILGICNCGCKQEIVIRNKKLQLSRYKHDHVASRTPKDRRCVLCNSDKTLIEKRGYPHWRRYNDGWICNKCYNKNVVNPKWHAIYHPIFNKRKLHYKGESILLKSNPRKGICQWCNRKIGDEYINSRGKITKIKITQMHHFAEYHDNDPLKDTIELCNSCHAKETYRLWKLKHPNEKQKRKRN